MKNYISINGKILPEKKAVISIKDRGFRFGDGVFETCLITDGVIYNWLTHLKRLKNGLKAIKIILKNQSTHHHPNEGWNLHNITKCIPTFTKMTMELIKKNKIKNGYLRISISRGTGSVGYLPSHNVQPTIIIETIPSNPKPKTPVKLWISTIEKPSLKSLPVNYKLMNGLNSTLAKIEAVKNNCFDAVLLNNKNQICETSSANIFWIKNNILYTPHPDCGCLLGTIREKIIKLSPIKIKLAKAKIVDLLEADEAFITNVALGVLAIDKIANQQFKNKKYSKIFSGLLNNDIKEYVKKSTN